MNNNLEPWEADLRARVKDHEFPHDPSALADFKRQLASTPKPSTPPGAATTPFLKILLLLGAILVGGGLWFYYGVDANEPTETTPATETITPEASAPPAAVLPPAAHPPAVASMPAGERNGDQEDSLSGAPSTRAQRRVMTRGVDAKPRAIVPPPHRSAPRPRPTEGQAVVSPTRPQRAGVARIRVKRPIVKLPVPPRALPRVAVVPAPAPAPSRRERKRMYELIKE